MIVAPGAVRRPERSLAVASVAAWATFVLVTILVVTHPAGTDLDLWLAPRLFDATTGHEAIGVLGRTLDLVGGNIAGIALVACASAGLALRHHRLLAAYLLVSAIGGVVICTGIKALVDRPRPGTVGSLLSETSSSYPSGHATASITVFVALGLVALVTLRPRTRWWAAMPLFVLAFAIGVSRVAMGVHWPSDVLGGWALGIAWTSTSALLFVAVSGARGD